MQIESQYGKIIGVIAVAFIVLQLVQYIWKQNQIRQSRVSNNATNTNNIEVALNSITLQEDESTVSGEKLSSGQTDSLTILDTFIDACNQGKIDEAYSFLSEDCKTEMYPQVENFKKSYYDAIFSSGKRNISVENWTGNIYKVEYINDALATGVYEQENTIQDYITITTNKKGETKLNINNYIGKQDINKETEVYGITIKVIEKNTYMDYETYTFEITNNSGGSILINDKNNENTMYLQDTNEIKYKAYLHELSEAELRVSLKETKKVSIKYYNKYSSSKKINNIIFEKVILNYNAYVNYQNPEYYKDYGIIQINL